MTKADFIEHMEFMVEETNKRIKKCPNDQYYQYSKGALQAWKKALEKAKEITD